jgi:hypothetical protein
MGVAALILRVVAVVGQLCCCSIVSTIPAAIVHTIRQFNLDFLVATNRTAIVATIESAWG